MTLGEPLYGVHQSKSAYSILHAVVRKTFVIWNDYNQNYQTPRIIAVDRHLGKFVNACPQG